MNAKQATTPNTVLTPAQRAILSHAHEHTEGKITWFPDNIKGGARQKVIEGMSKRSLVTGNGTDWFVSLEGYDALGIPCKAVIAEEANCTEPVIRPTTREGSKQAQVLGMLKRPEGTTIAQICEATGWQQHTVRGAFAGTFKKKFGLVISSTKDHSGQRIYQITWPINEP